MDKKKKLRRKKIQNENQIYPRTTEIDSLFKFHFIWYQFFFFGSKQMFQQNEKENLIEMVLFGFLNDQREKKNCHIVIEIFFPLMID